MCSYNSTNTKILAEHEQDGGNTRMLLFHEFDNGRHEYVVGSYFTKKWYDGSLGYEHVDYSWDWGHYFNDIVDAVDYWKSAVLRTED